MTYDAGKGEREDEVEEKGFLASRVKLLDLVESVRPYFFFPLAPPKNKLSAPRAPLSENIVPPARFFAPTIYCNMLGFGTGANTHPAFRHATENGPIDGLVLPAPRNRAW